jgi:hypothetical protein
MKKEELAKAVANTFEGSADFKMGIYKFCLSRETAMLEEIEKPLKMYKHRMTCNVILPNEAIDEALSIIQRRKVDHA